MPLDVRRSLQRNDFEEARRRGRPSPTLVNVVRRSFVSSLFASIQLGFVGFCCLFFFCERTPFFLVYFWFVVGRRLMDRRWRFRFSLFFSLVRSLRNVFLPSFDEMNCLFFIKDLFC